MWVFLCVLKYNKLFLLIYFNFSTIKYLISRVYDNAFLRAVKSFLHFGTWMEEVGGPWLVGCLHLVVRAKGKFENHCTRDTVIWGTTWPRHEDFFKNRDFEIATQRAFRTHFQLGRRAMVPSWNTILRWVDSLLATGSRLKKTNRPFKVS